MAHVNWIDARKNYSWTVNLADFVRAIEYPGFFNLVIRPEDIVALENSFRVAIDEGGSFEVAGEICFWKNYGSFQSRDSITQALLSHLRKPDNWNGFMNAVKRLSRFPSYEDFIELQISCNQPQGFATPLTFLSFYEPESFPMIDRHIANWWRLNRGRYRPLAPIFSQRGDGWIQTYTSSQVKQNWDAYISWTEFCRDYARRVSKTYRVSWRARDVEMAVWETQKRSSQIDNLPKIDDSWLMPELPKEIEEDKGMFDDLPDGYEEFEDPDGERDEYEDNEDS
ncbi:hypothetical protein MUP77_08095 [Candidatus Bathyarchaeota archaeon]|nr:hypothetical protein [Candidatus Bathyarchaeota archaeon]